MSDPTQHDPLLRWLAFGHPMWMVASLALAALALRRGLALRRARRKRVRRAPDARSRHLRVAKPAVLMLLIGMLGGVGSSIWLRGWDPLHSFHSIVGLLVAGLFAASAALGHRIEAHRSRALDAHALLGGLALLFAALAAVAGFVLLP